MQRIAAACAAANVRVEFERSEIGFAVIFYRPVNHINTDDSIGENIGDSIGENIGVNETQKQIISKMKENSKISAKAIAEEIGIAPRNVEANIKLLKQAKIIKRAGTPKGGHWVVNQESKNNG